jgi:asparagine synthetase A
LIPHNYQGNLDNDEKVLRHQLRLISQPDENENQLHQLLLQNQLSKNQGNLPGIRTSTKR